MQYMGSKNAYAKMLIPIIKPNATGLYVEPFVGACGAMQHMRADVRIGIDVNKYLIALWDAVQSGWVPPKAITEEQYAFYKANQDHDPKMTAFVGFGCSFAGKFFGGYARGAVGDNTAINYAERTRNSLLKTRRHLSGIEFICASYRVVAGLIDKEATIYCDPPYAGTTAYASTFDSAAFWKWADKMTDDGHRVFVSEYAAPEHWKCLYSFKPWKGCLRHERQKEKLFVRADVRTKPVGFGLIKY